MTNIPDDLETKAEKKWRPIVILVLCALIPLYVWYLQSDNTSTQHTVLNTVTRPENSSEKNSVNSSVMKTVSIVPTSDKEPIDFDGTISKVYENSVEIRCCNGESIVTTKPEFPVKLKPGTHVRVMAELIKNYEILPDTPEVPNHTHWAFIDEIGPRYISISYFEDNGDVKYGNALKPPFPIFVNSGVAVACKDNIEYQIVEIEP